MAIKSFLSELFGGSASVSDRATAQPSSAYEGQLLRGNGMAPVYKIENGSKRWIVTEAVFLRNGYSWADVRVVPKSTVDNIPSGTDIT